MHVGVRHLESGDYHTDPIGLELVPEHRAYRFCYGHQVGDQVIGKVRPVIDFLARHDQCVARIDRGNGQKRGNSIVLPDEPTGNVAVHDHGED